MVCQRCGHLLREGATVCDQCGTEVPSRSRESGSGGRRQGKEYRPSSGRNGSMQPEEMSSYSPRPEVERHPRRDGAGKRTLARGITAELTARANVSAAVLKRPRMLVGISV